MVACACWWVPSAAVAGDGVVPARLPVAAPVARAVAAGFEIAGVATILLVACAATVRFAREARAASDRFALLPGYRANLGRGVLLGLELLVAGDIVGTVAVAPTFEGLGALAVVVAIRTFLSVSLGVEIEGRWPWRRSGGEEGAPKGGGGAGGSRAPRADAARHRFGAT
jgi:uncharacterized membrane protein